MNGLSVVLALVMSQSIVRDLKIDRSAVTDVQIIAANDDFVWFMPRAGRPTTLTSGGPSVFRLEKATTRVQPCIGNNSRQLTRFNLCHTCAQPRGQSLFTLDGEFGPDGTLLTPVPGAISIFSSGPNMVMTWGEVAFLSLAPGSLRQLTGRFTSFDPSTDGRFAAGIYGIGDRTVILERDGSESRHDGAPAGYAGNSFLFNVRGNLVNEDDEVLGPAGQPSSARVSTGLEAFELDDGQLLVTDATFTGTYVIDRRDAGQTLNVTRQFATFGAGQMMTVARYADGARFTVPTFDGQSLDDRLIRGNLELYADGGVVRRAEFADCPWKRWGQSPELLCDGDGGIWSRNSADSPQRQLMTSHPVGVGGPAFVAAGLLNGGPLLAVAPSVQWTDGVTVAPISMKDSTSAIGMVGSRVVLFEGTGVESPRGVILVDPLSGAERTLGLTPEWRPMPTGRELFLHRDATCEVMLLNNDGALIPIKRACLESVFAIPGGVMAISREPTKGKWLVFDPETRAFLPTEFSNEYGDRPLADARNDRAVFSRGQRPWFGIPGQSLDTNSQWNSALVDLNTGANVSGSASAIALSPQGIISWSLAPPEGPPTIQTWAGATFEAAGSVAPWRFTWTEKSLWMMSQSDVRVFAGDGFRVVSTEPARWWNSYAVGENLVVPAGRTISVLNPSGAARVLTPGEIQDVRVLRDVMWLSINDGVHGYEPYRFDGESLEFVADLVPGPLPSFPHFVQYARGRMLMEAGRADGTIGITSVEFQPEPQDDTARSPWELKADHMEKTGCQGCTEAPSIGWLVALLLVVLRDRRRVRAD
jgi:ELWxxDGT repeat protein